MKQLRIVTALWLAVASCLTCGSVSAGEQPVAIFHAFDQNYADVANYVCDLQKQGYSHVQIAPAQKSNPDGAWWARYQPLDYSSIEGRGSLSDLKKLTRTAHGCNMKVIADVVFNHMTDYANYASTLTYPQFGPEDFHPAKWEKCPKGGSPDYSDGNRDTEIYCRWNGSHPDLDQSRQHVKDVHFKHISDLISAGVDGFRFDAAKHMSNDAVADYIRYINDKTSGAAWNYLEVIEDHDTRGEDYNGIAAVTDFRFHDSLKSAFGYGGDLRSLAFPAAVDDSRSVVFGANHDTVRDINSSPQHEFPNRGDTYLATAFVLAHEYGTPLVLNRDNIAIAYIPAGVKFRQIMQQRGREGKKVHENVLLVVKEPAFEKNVLVMERGEEGFFVVNKAAEKYDTQVTDLTLSHLEGCYREVRNRNLLVAVERRVNGNKYITRWGSKNRGGMEVYPRDALYFFREPWEVCR